MSGEHTVGDDFLVFVIITFHVNICGFLNRYGNMTH